MLLIKAVTGGGWEPACALTAEGTLALCLWERRIQVQSGLTCPDSPFFLTDQQMFFFYSSYVAPSLPCCWSIYPAVDQVTCWLWSVLNSGSHASSMKARVPLLPLPVTMCSQVPSPCHSFQNVRKVPWNGSYTWRKERIFSGCCCFVMISRGLDRGSRGEGCWQPSWKPAFFLLSSSPL